MSSPSVDAMELLLHDAAKRESNARFLASMQNMVSMTLVCGTVMSARTGSRPAKRSTVSGGAGTPPTSPPCGPAPTPTRRQKGTGRKTTRARARIGRSSAVVIGRSAVSVEEETDGGPD